VGLPEADCWPYLLVSALLHSAYIMLLMRAYEGGQLAVSYLLMRGLAPLLVGLASAPCWASRWVLPAGGVCCAFWVASR
ncbi:MAG: hypothetical protein Q7U45_11595, partial [Burkholderiaceae bacterium]|nr:hypothetical protein [Burkholderiaceae bacterium]